MRAVVCRELGPPSNLVVEERDPLTAGPGQVVVDVEAAGVNYVDALFVQGRYQIKPPLPFVPGSEIAGTVSAVADDVDSLRVGDRVLVSCGLGGFAEQVVTRAHSATRIPDNLEAGQAAAFTQSYATAMFALRDRGRLVPGETVLVLGAGGGVGLAMIDVARAMGAHPIGAASSPAKRDAAAAMGAVATIDTTGESIKDRARELAVELSGRPVAGVDVAVDPIGGELADGALRALGEGGRYLVIGFASGSIPSLPLNQVLLRNRQVVGVDWGAWAMSRAEEQDALLAGLLGLVEGGRLHPTAPTTHPLDQVGRALDDLLSRRVVGKVALVP
jgi:NADPH:quinone reductase